MPSPAEEDGEQRTAGGGTDGADEPASASGERRVTRNATTPSTMTIAIPPIQRSRDLRWCCAWTSPAPISGFAAAPGSPGRLIVTLNPDLGTGLFAGRVTGSSGSSVGWPATGVAGGVGGGAGLGVRLNGQGKCGDQDC